MKCFSPITIAGIYYNCSPLFKEDFLQFFKRCREDSEESLMKFTVSNGFEDVKKTTIISLHLINL